MNERMTRRWRLILGQHADASLELNEQDQQVDQALAFLYDREQASRAAKLASWSGTDAIKLPQWLSNIRRLFPSDAADVLEQDALHRYGLDELLLDPDVLARTTPNLALLQSLMAFRDRIPPELLDQVEDICDHVIFDLRQTWERWITKHSRAPANQQVGRGHRNIQWKRTLAANLRHHQPEYDGLVLQKLHFQPKSRAAAPRRVILVVDQSGSMIGSLVHAAVVASVFAKMPHVDPRLVLFDHRVVDASEDANDPVKLLLSAQLGGGTKLLPALNHAATLVSQPAKTVLVVISDWLLSGEHEACLQLALHLRTCGVQCFGLTALDDQGQGAADQQFVRSLRSAGWWAGACTPQQLAQKLGPLLG